jgi:hypothetical protein
MIEKVQHGVETQWTAKPLTRADEAHVQLGLPPHYVATALTLPIHVGVYQLPVVLEDHLGKDETDLHHGEA